MTRTRRILAALAMLLLAPVLALGLAACAFGVALLGTIKAAAELMR